MVYPQVTSLSPEDLILQADLMTVRLEFMRGLPVWEASPTLAHQLEVERIRASITTRSGEKGSCIHIAEVLFQFPDNSFVRTGYCGTPQASLSIRVA